ncbi:hypothetical protein LEP1GSC199_1691 [Leptospira vanthielii serovar Holland str. Waz Holland = ATCC 700522]|uniref:Uncharacterized protein n=1 Tax=Leptospira vanthielii serovar Holland str. Waz Holland = ATCC 700522 TaxID=1218591 RepID=N1W1H4_9LEPT|nr:hypothetical protein LEP1GSC199_1691 [Leptospira vanthielii serovar Holland str. Waz Holland = ATCC 700522]
MNPLNRRRFQFQIVNSRFGCVAGGDPVTLILKEIRMPAGTTTKV